MTKHQPARFGFDWRTAIAKLHEFPRKRRFEKQFGLVPAFAVDRYFVQGIIEQGERACDIAGITLNFTNSQQRFEFIIGSLNKIGSF